MTRNPRRRRLASLGLALALLVIARPALAQDVPAPGEPPTASGDVTADEGITEMDAARSLLRDALAAYRAGEPELAYELARNAYLDHFEYTEIPLRILDEGLTLEVEEEFAALRSMIEEGEPANEVAVQTARVSQGLDDVERVLDTPGVAAPLIATVYSFFILFREGLEAMLVVAAVLGYLEASRAVGYRRPFALGVVGAIVLSLVTFWLVTMFLDQAPFAREVMEAAITIAAVVVLFYVSFWMLARLDQRRWMEFLKAKVWAAAATGSAVALAAVGFTTVYREGLETALFYQALLGYAAGLEAYVALGAAVSLVVLLGIGWAIFRQERRVPVRTALTVALVVVMVMSVSFIGNAVRELQEALLLPVTYLEGLPRLPVFLADLTGYHPTVQSLTAQVLLIAFYAAGFVMMRRRQRGARPADDAAPVAASAPDPATAP
jgi:high-affinity iron transporter